MKKEFWLFLENFMLRMEVKTIANISAISFGIFVYQYISDGSMYDAVRYSYWAAVGVLVSKIT